MALGHANIEELIICPQLFLTSYYLLFKKFSLGRLKDYRSFVIRSKNLSRLKKTKFGDTVISGNAKFRRENYLSIDFMKGNGEPYEGNIEYH